MAEVARARISKILGSAKRLKRNTTKDEEGVLTQLRKNEAIVVAEADKANVTVVMDVVDYDKKAEEIRLRRLQRIQRERLRVV